jgi:hypothetical protein
MKSLTDFTLRSNVIQKFWSKFKHLFRKLDHFSGMEKIVCHNETA